MRSLQQVTEDCLHTPQGDHSIHTTIIDHAHNPFNPHHESTLPSLTTPNAHPPTIFPDDTPTDCPTPIPSNLHSYTSLPLPELNQQDIRIISHNINTLHMTTTAELGATFDLYSEFQPTIIGLQETNKNWSLYDKTEAPLRTIVNWWWPGAKIVTAHCKDSIFQSPYQPGGVAQFVLRQLTGRVIDHNKDKLGRYAWQTILINGSRNLIIMMAYWVSQEMVTNCGYTTSVMQQWQQLKKDRIENPNPWQQTLNDMKNFIQGHISSGNKVMVMINVNSHSQQMNADVVAYFWYDVAYLSTSPYR